jgi:hypothetical protein
MVTGEITHTIVDSQQPLLLAWSSYLLQRIIHTPTAGKPPFCDQWEALFTIAQQQQLAPLLYWALQQNREEGQPPPAIKQQMRRQYVSATIQALQQEQELRTILTTLNDRGIRPTLYKGAALAHTLYPTSACRPMGDLDLWVTVDEMATAQAALEGLGYQLNTREERPLALQSQQDGEVPLISRQPGKGVVELHWGVFPGQWLQRVAAVDRQGVKQRRVATTLLGASVYLLANEDALIQLATHLGISHQLSRFPLRSLFDIALLDQQSINWAVVIERTIAWRLTTVMSVVLDLLVSVFGPTAITPAALAAATTLRKMTEGRPFAERWRNPSILLNQTKLSRSRSRFLFLLSMIDRPQDILYLLTRTFWPETEWLAARYGSVNHKVRLAHIKAALQGSL